MAESLERIVFLVNLMLIVIIVSQVKGHGNGAPESRCDSMLPGHWIPVQSSKSPFHVTFSQRIIHSGDVLKINLTAEDDQEGFKGFLVLVKKPGESDTAFGKFLVPEEEKQTIQTLDCFGKVASAATHVDNSKKQFVQLLWTPADNADQQQEEYEIRATFVQNFWTYWTDVKASKSIIVVKESITSTTNEPRAFEFSTPSNSTSTDLKPPSTFNTNMVVQETTEYTPKIMLRNEEPSAGDSTTIFEDGWDFFKSTWLKFLKYFGF